VVGLLPLLAVVALAAAHLLVAAATHELAGHAAEAAAIAVGHGTDPRAAAREALPGWARGGLTVTRAGRRVRVRLRPPAAAPRLADLIATSVTADAGPAPP